MADKSFLVFHVNLEVWR